MTKFRVDLVLDCAEPKALEAFWADALRYHVHLSLPSIVVLVPTDGEGPPLVLQQVPEPKVAKNRMHLDITCDDIEAEVERLERLGAKRTHDGARSLGDTRWVTLTDPVGNEFCVCTGVEW